MCIVLSVEVIRVSSIVKLIHLLTVLFSENHDFENADCVLAERCLACVNWMHEFSIVFSVDENGIFLCGSVPLRNFLKCH
jgi:hypothetical protein